jgi:hypothetical protein
MDTEPKETWESPSLDWIHRIREDHYRRTKDLPLESWLGVADPQTALTACEELGLKVRLSGRKTDRTARPKET